MQNSNISFTSRIAFVNTRDFVLKMPNLGPEINKPWTFRQITRAEKAHTTKVRTCTAGGILVKNKEGKNEVIMFHLCPPEERTPRNKNFLAISNRIRRLLREDKPIQGFLIGSKQLHSYSENFFNQMEAFLKNTLKIPYSKFKLQENLAGSHIAYDGALDTWFVNSTSVNIANDLDKAYRNIVISKSDVLDLSQLQPMDLN